VSILKTEDLTYVYGEGTPFRKKAVDQVSLEINEGEITGIIGHTGSGKSTLVQLFNGLLKPSSGKVLFKGKDIWEGKKIMPGLRSKVGLVFQYPEYQLFEETVYKDIAFGPGNMGLSQDEIKERVLQAADLFDISESMLKKSPFELSGGQKRRVAVAGVMAMRPEVLILDEPAAGLDPASRDRIFGLISSYSRKTGCTVLMISHSMEDMAKYAEKIIVMNKSRLYCHDTVPNVFSHADEISGMGLDIPQITKIVRALREYGIEFDEEIYTVGYARKKIIEYIERKGGAVCSEI